MGATRNTENTPRNANANANMIPRLLGINLKIQQHFVCDNSRAETCKR